MQKEKMNINDNLGNLLATVIRLEDISEGKNFITDNASEFQLASFNLEKDTVIENHYHPEQKRLLYRTSEVLVVIDGEMEVQIYDNNLDHVTNILLKSGDTIALIDGGHGITFNTNTKFVEVKQGPYDESTDKKRF
jgi:cupin fold WbuC family metalloprotein